MNRGPPTDLSIEEAIDLFIRRKRPDWNGETPRTYRRNLGNFEEYAEENEITTVEELSRWTVSGFTDWLLAQDLARVTVASRQKTAKTWLKFLESQGVIEPGLHVAIDTIQMTDEEETSDQQLQPTDARTLLSFYRESSRWRGKRQHAILELIWHVGCRKCGVRALDLRDYEDGVLKFRHRPDSGTRLKEGQKHERNVVLSQTPRKVLDLFVAREWLDKRDGFGRTPLFPSEQGRPVGSTIGGWMYEATQPCMAEECPHGKRRPNCKWVPSDPTPSFAVPTSGAASRENRLGGGAVADAGVGSPERPPESRRRRPTRGRYGPAE